MANYKTSRILPVALVIVIIVIAIIALVSLARAVFFSGSNTATNSSQTDSSESALLDTSAGHSVTMTVRGPIVADEQFRSYEITISPTSRTMTTYTGYLDTVVDQRTLGNNVAAYGEFVNALDKANLAKGKQFSGDKNDTSGICATGRVYDFSIKNNSDVVKDLWTSTCSGSRGSLNASVDQVSNLFYKQIPDSNSLIDRINL